MYTYKIRGFNASTGQVIVQYEDLAPCAIDLAVDENGKVPEGEALDKAIRDFMPVWHFQRQEQLANGISNADAVAALVEPLPPPPEPDLEDVARQQRNFLLAASDWTQVADAPLTEEQKTAWAIYRQALRDIPSQEGFPAEINWPEAP
jgi:hypothetical protein